jgi:integrase
VVVSFQEIQVFGIQNRPLSERTKRPWIVRWAVALKRHSKSFHTRAEAERYRSLLTHAKTLGETFDEVTGEPLSWRPTADDVQVHIWARRWLAEEWPEWAPRTRVSALEAIARFVPLLHGPDSPTPPIALRAHLYASLPPAPEGPPDNECEKWLGRWCLKMGQLNRQVLAAAERQLLMAGDGQPLAASTASRFRKVAHACVRRAVDLEVLPADPWPPRPKGRSQRKATRTRTVDLRRLPEPRTMAAAIANIASHQPGSLKYQVMTAVVYYAGLRPSEVIMLRPRALRLPEAGWGRLDVTEADVSFDEPGEPKTGPRSVPVPPVLVNVLRAWVDDHDLAPDDLLFRTRNGKLPTRSNWSRAWQRALRATGVAPLRIYDCRHAAATTWLKAGAPLGEVARRLGHSVETLVSTYVGALAEDETLANERIAKVLAG